MDVDDEDATNPTANAGNDAWHSAGDFSQQLQLNADEESQFSAFSSGHSATIFVVDISTDMLRTQLAGGERSKSAFQWAITAVLTSVRQLVFANRNDHVGLVVFGCRQQPKILQDEEFHDDSDELQMRTAHTVMYLHKAGLDTLRALRKLSKADEDTIERQSESLSPGPTTSSVRIIAGEALWKAHRMLEYANQWFASKRVIILTVSDDPHGAGGSTAAGRKNTAAHQNDSAGLAQQFTCDRAIRLHEAGTEVFVVPFKLAGDAEFDMSILYGKVQKINNAGMLAKKNTVKDKSMTAALEISPDNVDDIENKIEILVESPIIKRPLCKLPLRLSNDYALPVVVYHPITKFTKLPLLWLKSANKNTTTRTTTTAAASTSSTAGGAAAATDADDAGNDDEENDTGDQPARGGRMHVIKRHRVFVDPATSSIVPNDEVKKRMFLLGREIVFSHQEAKSWKEFDVPLGFDILASCPLSVAQRFVWKNYIKPTLLVTVKLTGEVKEQATTLKLFKSLLSATEKQSRALIVRYTPPTRLGATRIAILLPDAAVDFAENTEIDAVHDDSNSTERARGGLSRSKSPKRTQNAARSSTQAAAATSHNNASGFQMFIVPYIQELRDVVDKIYERSNALMELPAAQYHDLVGKYADVIDALSEDWSPHKYRNPAVYQYYLKLEAEVCKWSRDEIPEEIDDPTIPDYDNIAARAGDALLRLQEASSSSSRGAKKPTSAARGGRAAGRTTATAAAAGANEKKPSTARTRGGSRAPAATRHANGTRSRGRSVANSNHLAAETNEPGDDYDAVKVEEEEIGNDDEDVEQQHQPATKRPRRNVSRNSSRTSGRSSRNSKI